MRMNLGGVIGELDTLPGCTQIVVSNSVFVPQELRGQGRGTQANKNRMKIAHELGYDMMICTVSEDNENQRKVLTKNGWSKYTEFKSRKTGHTVELWGIHLVP